MTKIAPFLPNFVGTRVDGRQGAPIHAARVDTVKLAGVEDFRGTRAEVHLATEDGSAGFRGRVTSLLVNHDRPHHLVGCGPEPMLHAVADLAKTWRVPCHLSLETPMACGVGICFTCVTPVRTGDGWDYRRVCVDGPVFDAACLAWDKP